MAETSDHDILLLLRNDVIHLTATMELFRGDFRDSVANQDTQFKEHAVQFKEHAERISEMEKYKTKAESRWSIIKWVVGTLTVVVGSVAAAVGKWALGI